VSGGGREVSVVDEVRLCRGSTLRRSIARMWLEGSLHLRELLTWLWLLSRPHWRASRSKLCLLLHSQLLLMLLHQFKLMRQLLEDILLLRREVLCLLECVKHLQLLLGEIERRSLLLLWLHRLFAGLKSLCRYCIIVALDRVGRWSSWIRLLQIQEKLEVRKKFGAHVMKF
jgi:hypothetical protein